MIRKVNARKLLVDLVKLEDRLSEVANLAGFTGPVPYHVDFMCGKIIVGRYHFWLRPVEMPKCDHCQSVNWHSEDYRFTSRADSSTYISLLVGTCLSCGKKVAFTFRA
jgi:hypothetical protein